MFGRLGDFIEDLADIADVERMERRTRKFVKEQEGEIQKIHERKKAEFAGKDGENRNDEKQDFEEALSVKLQAIVRKYYPECENDEVEDESYVVVQAEEEKWNYS